jgi:hypothetical protein
MRGRSLRRGAETMTPLLAVLDGTLTWAQHEVRCPKDQEREQLMQMLEATRQRLLRRG